MSLPFSSERYARYKLCETVQASASTQYMQTLRVFVLAFTSLFHNIQAHSVLRLRRPTVAFGAMIPRTPRSASRQSACKLEGALQECVETVRHDPKCMHTVQNKE